MAVVVNTPSNGAAKKQSMSFMKKGKDAVEALNREEAKAEEARKNAGNLWRFFIAKENLGEDFQITFLDGELGEDGTLDIPMWYEHMAQYNGKWNSFVCINENEPCPFCEGGDQATLVGGLTVIDHTEYLIEKGKNAGQTRKNQRKLYIPKRGTIKLLQKLAVKQGGLTGCTFEISRSTDKSPSVGDLFQFVEKASMTDLRDKYGKDHNENWVAEPADYEKEIVYRDAATLSQMGFGSVHATIGGDKSDLSDEL